MDDFLGIIIIGGNLIVFYNSEMIDISGLGNIDLEIIINLFICGNLMLFVCVIESVCYYLMLDINVVII